ncbi:LacI family DNA-binding transcriptional regulator [Propionicimonas sp.]|uniref:LacI family DNA-binding transcriptional regulator n=1 Tax=Propionicimonas sp. TaxID=1955623 RepID=UPI0039E53F4E
MARFDGEHSAPTLEDVARIAGVSRATVSRVVNGGTLVAAKTTEAVRAAINEIGYHPNRAARALVTRRTGVIAVIVPETDERVFTDPYFPQAYHGALQAFAGSDVQVVLAMAQPGDSASRMVRYLESGHVDGAIIVSHHGPELATALAHSWQPVVFVGDPEAPGVCYVDLDNTTAARMATRHLVSRGCRSIGTITGPLDMASARSRLAGFEEAMAEAGLDSSLRVEGGYTARSGETVTELLQRCPDMDGLFVANDLMAVTAMGVVQRSGRRVPEDVKIVGFDDAAIGLQCNPQLTTMTNPADEHTRTAAEMLIELLAGEVPQNPRMMRPSRLVVRGSA